MNQQLLLALASGAVAPQLAVSNGENPQVSAVSRFHDQVWDFSNEDRNPSLSSARKRICWSFRMPGRGLFTDAPFRSLLTTSKQFIYAMRWHPLAGPPLAPTTLQNQFRSLKRFIAHLASYPHPILRFKDVLPPHCEDYVEELLSSRLSVGSKYHYLSVLEKLVLYSRVMKDGLVIDPLKGELAGKVVGRNKSSVLEGQTEIIPDEILRPLVQGSLEYLDRFAGYLLHASEAVEEMRKRESGRRSGFGRCSIRWLHERPPSAYGLAGSKLENGLSSFRQLNRELCYLQTACFVLIAFATGMRLSEILSLQAGCWEIEKEPGQADLVWLRSRVFNLNPSSFDLALREC